MPRPKGPALTRDAVITAAIHSLEADGVEGFGINRVARTLGIKPPSLYNHVSSNDDLREAVVLAGWSRLAQDFDAAARSGAPAVRTLTQMADAYRAFAQSHPALYALMSSTTLDPQQPAAGDVASRIIESLATVLPPIRSEGLHAIRALRAAMHGFVMLELAGQLGDPQSADLSYRWMIDGLTRIALPQETQA